MGRNVTSAGSNKAQVRAEQAQKQYAEDAGYLEVELTRLKLDEIDSRAHGDTRALNPEQVKSLQESISLLGLIAPLAIDSQNRLLAGSHRRAALQSLAEESSDRFTQLFADGIPCRRFAFDSLKDPETALAVEISENEKRRNYTRDEIKTVAEQLQKQGYSRQRGRGNRQPLTPALMTAFGVSRSVVMRALREPSSNVSAGTFGRPTTRRIAGLELPTAIADQVEQLAHQQRQKPKELLLDLITRGLEQRS